MNTQRARVLDLIQSSLRERGHGPTLREIAASIANTPSSDGAKGHVHRMIVELEREGYIMRPTPFLRDVILLDGQPRLRRPADFDDVPGLAEAARKAGNTHLSLPIGTVLDWHAYTFAMERTVAMPEASEQDQRPEAPVRNRWNTTCVQCGGPIARGEGVAIKIEGKWRAHHLGHSGLTQSQIDALPEVGPKAPTEEERAARRAR